MFALFILLRVLFIASMVFIIGYIFGPFAKNRTLTVFSRIAAIMVIVLFIATNVASFRGGRGYRYGNWNHECGYNMKDSTEHRGALPQAN